ncbi:MAG: sodium:solute symporter family protein [Rickettsia sp.]|nr:sodium:solute symporter family protein [Rickettsia sp.]
MNLNYIDIFVIGFFGISVLISGFMNVHKVRNFEDFAVGDKNFSLSALVATLTATYFSGSTFFMTIENTYQRGILYLVTTILGYMGIVFTALVLVPKMQTYLKNISLAESIGKFYGNLVRSMIAITILISAIGMLAVQFKAFGKIICYFSQTNSIWALIIPAIILITYSSLGGIKSVIYTDIVQFIAFIIPIGIIASLTIKTAFTLQKIENYTFISFFSNGQSIKELTSEYLGLSIFVFLSWCIEPVTSQRIFLNKDKNFIKKALLVSFMIFVLLRISLSILPITILKINPTLDPKDLIYFVLNEFAYNPGIKGILIIGVVAMTMSTADSWINLASVSLVNDILFPFKIKFFDQNKLIFVKIFSFLLGVSAIFLAIEETNILSIIQKTTAFYVVSTVPVAILTILGFRTYKYNILAAMISGMFFFFIFKYLVDKLHLGGDSNSYTIVISTFFTTIFVLSVHYIFRLKGGWMNKKDPLNKFIESEKRKEKLANFFNKIKNFNFKKELIVNTPSNSVVYLQLGIYLILWDIFLVLKEYQNIIIFFVFTLSVIISILLFFHSSIKMRTTNRFFYKYSLLIWNFTLFCLLSFGNLVFFLFNPMNTTSCTIFLVNNLVLFLFSKEYLAYFVTLLSMIVVFIINCIFSKLSIVTYHTLPYQYAIVVFLVLIIALIVTFFIKPFYRELKIHKELLDETETRLDRQHEYIRELESHIIAQNKKYDKVSNK